MKNISDYDFSRISAFVDGELETNEVYSLIADMQTKPELKDLYFNLLELSEVSVNLKSLGFREKLAKLSLQDLLAAFTQKVVLPMTIFSVGALLSYSILNNALYNQLSSILRAQSGQTIGTQSCPNWSVEKRRVR